MSTRKQKQFDFLVSLVPDTQLQVLSTGAVSVLGVTEKTIKRYVLLSTEGQFMPILAGGPTTLLRKYAAALNLGHTVQLWDLEEGKQVPVQIEHKVRLVA